MTGIADTITALRNLVSFRISEKGGVSVYGLGRFPVTLYKEQWIKLLDVAEDIRTFIKNNDAQLKTKEVVCLGSAFLA